MPRYYFHLHHEDDVLIDAEGLDIADPREMPRRALAIVRDLIAADVITGLVDLDTSLRVADEADAAVFELIFSDAVTFVSRR